MKRTILAAIAVVMLAGTAMAATDTPVRGCRMPGQAPVGKEDVIRFPQKKTKRQQFRLEARQEAGLEKLAKRHDSTISALIRYAIDELLERELGSGAQK
jgi:hypothetical protein